MVCRLCDQSTVVVTPASRDSIAASPVTRGDVLGPELLAVLEVVPDEVLGQRPVGAVPTHGRLPHVAVRVGHAPGHDAPAGADLLGALGHGQTGAETPGPVVHGEHVRGAGPP